MVRLCEDTTLGNCLSGTSLANLQRAMAEMESQVGALLLNMGVIKRCIEEALLGEKIPVMGQGQDCRFGLFNANGCKHKNIVDGPQLQASTPVAQQPISLAKPVAQGAKAGWRRRARGNSDPSSSQPPLLMVGQESMPKGVRQSEVVAVSTESLRVPVLVSTGTTAVELYRRSIVSCSIPLTLEQIQPVTLTPATQATTATGTVPM